MDRPWRPFRLQAPHFTGLVDSHERWRGVVDAHPWEGDTVEKLRTAPFVPGSFTEAERIPTFEVRPPYHGELTLGKWARAFSIDLSVEPLVEAPPSQPEEARTAEERMVEAAE